MPLQFVCCAAGCPLRSSSPKPFHRRLPQSATWPWELCRIRCRWAPAPSIAGTRVVAANFLCATPCPFGPRADRDVCSSLWFGVCVCMACGCNRFVTVPRGATWADIIVRRVDGGVAGTTAADAKDSSARLLVVHAVQVRMVPHPAPSRAVPRGPPRLRWAVYVTVAVSLVRTHRQVVPHKSLRHTEKEQYLRMLPGGCGTVTMPVLADVTLELVIAQFWSSLGDTAVAVDLCFKGMDVSPSPVRLGCRSPGRLHPGRKGGGRWRAFLGCCARWLTSRARYALVTQICFAPGDAYARVSVVPVLHDARVDPAAELTSWDTVLRPKVRSSAWRNLDLVSGVLSTRTRCLVVCVAEVHGGAIDGEGHPRHAASPVRHRAVV